MARSGTRKITTTVEEGDDDLRGILKSLSPDGEWIVKIYRYQRWSSTPGWICSKAPSEVSEEALAEEFGPGKYLIRPWSESENKWGKAKTVAIDSGEHSLTAQGSTLQAPQYDGSAVADKMLTMQQASTDRMMQMMQAANQQMLTLVTAIITSSAGKQIDPIALATLFKESNSGGGSNMAMFKDMLGLAKEMVGGGGAGESDPWLSLITAVVPKVLEARNPTPPPAQPATPAPPAAAAPAAPGGARTEEEIVLEERKSFIELLKKKALKNAPIDEWADYIEDNVEDEGPHFVLGITQQYPWPQVAAGLVSLDNELAAEPYLTWFKNLYDALRIPVPPVEGKTNEE